MRYQHTAMINGVFCRIYAKEAPTREVTDVILYCHGGAFITSLHVGDIPLLTTWAMTGAVIVVPDYSLAPEHP